MTDPDRPSAPPHETYDESRRTDLRPVSDPEKVSEMDDADRANGEPDARD